ncbi:hypothetical protein DYH09_06200 [bacterium CPR1]|nr:hypothetical protein [bacterium CPR1]
MLGPTQLAQLLPLTDINHKVAGEGVQAPPVQPGVTQAIPNATYANVAGQNKQGYALDFNNNGTFDRNDGVLAFDLNKDGKMTAREIEQSRTMLKVFSGDSDLNGDGKVGGLEGMVAQKMREKFAEKYDRDGNGQLGQNELAQAGARVLSDTNGDGRFAQSEVYTTDNILLNTPAGPNRAALTGIGSNGQVGLSTGPTGP